MPVPSTMSFADLYGYRTPGRSGNNDAPDEQKASGGSVSAAVKNPAVFWVGLVALLVVTRFLWEKGS